MSSTTSLCSLVLPWNKKKVSISAFVIVITRNLFWRWSFCWFPMENETYFNFQDNFITESWSIDWVCANAIDGTFFVAAWTKTFKNTAWFTQWKSGKMTINFSNRSLSFRGSFVDRLWSGRNKVWFTNLPCCCFSQRNALYDEAIRKLKIPVLTILDLRKQFVPSAKVVEQVEEIQTLLERFLNGSAAKWYTFAANRNWVDSKWQKCALCVQSI